MTGIISRIEALRRKHHPAQSNKDLLLKLQSAFEKNLRDKKLLPKNPFKAGRTIAWLDKLGCRVHPLRSGQVFLGPKEIEKFVYFYVRCDKPKVRIRGTRSLVMMVACPWELADKVLVFGCLPDKI